MKDAIKTRINEADFEQLVQIEERLATLSIQAREIADACGLPRREIAARMGNASPSTLQRLLSGLAYNASLDTVARFAWACGHDLQVTFVPQGEQKAPRLDNEIVENAETSKVVAFQDYYRRQASQPAWVGPCANTSFSEFDFGSAKSMSNAH